ncbi:MAG: hypothetical protein WCT05_04945 [Lentisphaeria bacterium]
MPFQADPEGTFVFLASRRIRLILVAGGLLTILLLGRAAWLANQRNKQKALVEELMIPGLRGSICNRDGQPLAWSERQLRLKWRVPRTLVEAMDSREHLVQNPVLSGVLPPSDKLEALLGEELVLLESIKVPLFPELTSLVELEGFFLEGYFVRCTSLPESLAENVLGKVTIDPVSGLEIGISGLEKEYDPCLRGRVLRYNRVDSSNNLTRLYNTFFSDTGNGENIMIDWKP